MNCKWLWFLAIALIFGFSALTEARIPFRPPPRRPPRKGGKNCNVPANRRIECGFPGISRQQCLGRACCFSTRLKNAKWCFRPR